VPPLKGITVKLLVIDDPPMAQAISLLRGQWQAETGAELVIDDAVGADRTPAAEQGDPPVDAVIYPPQLLGTMVENAAIRHIKHEDLDSPDLDWADVCELVKSREVTWGGEVYALPLGSPVFVCFYRQDLLEPLGRNPPRTWEEYRQLAELLQRRGPPAASDAASETAASAPRSAEKRAAEWHGTVEPLAPGWAGLTLLAHAACYARHPNHYSTLFNMASMEPLVASAPFVRALEDLVATAKLAPESLELAPGDAWHELVAGHAAMAICWPAASSDAADGVGATAERCQRLEIGCVEVPGAAEVFNATSGAWETRAGGVANVPLLGVAGRIGSIAARSPHPEAALRLLTWLASRKWSDRTSAASAATAPFRASQLRAPQAWAHGMRPAEAAQYATAVADSLNATDCLLAPRIPGAQRYLAALDDAVRRSALGEAEPQAALDAAADRWRAITAELGLERQRSAYRHSLGLE